MYFAIALYQFQDDDDFSSSRPSDRSGSLGTTTAR
jgi:hypothetical protein